MMRHTAMVRRAAGTVTRKHIASILMIALCCVFLLAFPGCEGAQWHIDGGYNEQCGAWIGGGVSGTF